MLKSIFFLILVTFNLWPGIRYYNHEADFKDTFAIITSAFNELKEPRHTTPQQIIDDFFFLPSLYKFVYEKENHICGFLSLFKQNIFLRPEDSNKAIGTIEHLAVSPSFKHKGIGTQLIKFALQKMRTWKRKRVSVCTYKKNHPAHEFFEQFGFKLLPITPENGNDPLVKTFDDPDDFLFDLYVIDL